MDFPKPQSRLPSSSSSSIPPHKTQLHPRMHSHPFSLSSPNPNIKYLLLFLSLSLLPFILYLLSLYRSIHLSSQFSPSSSSSIFGLVIHIDDFGSGVRVFQALDKFSGGPFAGKGSDSTWVEPGFLGFSTGVGLAERVVVKLVEFAKQRVPNSQWSDTKVQLMVNGNVDRNQFDVRERVLEECRNVLRRSGFLFKDDWASVLNGKDAGVYGWIAVNYALGYLGNEPEQTTGIVELGGSSMQVTFASREHSPSEFSRFIRFAGVSYSLYTQSMPEFGQDAGWNSLHELRNSQDSTSFSLTSERTVTNPCIPRGHGLTSNASDVKLVTSHGAGNYSSCKSQVLSLLKGRQGKCSSPPCNIVPFISVELKQQPDPQQRFIYSSKFLGPVSKASLAELEASGHHFCENEWDQLKNQHNDIDEEDLLKRCFSHAYAVVLLENDINIPAYKNRVKLERDAVDWSLGAFIAQMMIQRTPLKHEFHMQDHVIMDRSLTFFLLFAVLLALVLVAAFFVMKSRKPQFKTIYDLEKGRYFVTPRLPR